MPHPIVGSFEQPRPNPLALLTEGKEPIGEPVYVRSSAFVNRVTTTKARMDDLLPPEA